LGSLPAAVGVSFDEEFVADGHEPVDGGLGEQRVTHDGDPFRWVAVGRYYGAGLLVPFEDEPLEVAGLGGMDGL
jgi:hypothetical protein